MAKDDLILMAEQGRMIGLLLLLYYYFQCLLKFCREEEVASESVVRVHFTKGIDFCKKGSSTFSEKVFLKGDEEKLR